MDTDLTADTIGAGGEDVVFPLMPAMFLAGGALNGIYAVGKASDSFRYWSDYYRNTGYRSRYPWRTGQYDWIRNSGSTFNSFGGAFYSYGKLYR